MARATRRGRHAAPSCAARQHGRDVATDTKGRQESVTLVSFDVPGIHCGGCVASVTTALEDALHSHMGERAQNVSASANLVTKRATVSGPPSMAAMVDVPALEDALSRAGYAAQANANAAELRSITLDVPAMHCGSCVAAIQSVLSAESLRDAAGVVSSSANLATRQVRVRLAADGKLDEVLQELKEAGYEAQVLRSEGDADNVESDVVQRSVTPLERYRQEADAIAWRVWSAGALVAVSVAGHLGHVFGHGQSEILDVIASPAVQGVVATATLAFPASQLIGDGMKQLFRGQPNMHSLLSLGVLAAYGSSVVSWAMPHLGWSSAFSEATMVAGFVLAGQALEARARLRASSSLQQLLELQPRHANVVEAGEETDEEKLLAAPSKEVDIAEVPVGAHVRVVPGDRFPVDGVVVGGASSCDRAALTGESVPVPLRVGDKVSGGTLNVDGVVIVRATATGARSAVAQIVAVVEEAQGRPARIQRRADAIAGAFAWGVMGLAVTTAGFWGLGAEHLGLLSNPSVATFAGGSGAWVLGLRLAIDVMVVACPCALGLATPMAVLVGSGAGAERGLLLRGADVLERARGVTDIVFDKTGTLTRGDATVHQVVALPGTGLQIDEVLALAAAVEKSSRHPLAKAIVKAADAARVDAVSVTNVEVEAGMGITGECRSDSGDAFDVSVGSERYMRSHACEIDDAAAAAAARIREEGNTAVVVARAGVAIGVLAIGDTLRADACSAIDKLQARGIQVHLLSGDSQAAAEAVAALVGIPSSNVHAEVLPVDKANVVAKLQERSPTSVVAMVGDGVNDAPALAQADVGIALASGAEVALEAADLVLTRVSSASGGSGLDDVPRALQLADMTHAKIRQNLAWAFGYNALALPAAAGAFLPAAGVVLTPAMAGAAHALSSIAVIGNSALLKGEIERRLPRL